MEDFSNTYKQICSSETIYSHRRGFFNVFCEATKQLVGIEYILNIFININEDQDRILQMYTDKNISQIVIKEFQKQLVLYKKKDAINSKKKRIDSLRLENNNKFMNVLHQLNQAVLLAPEIGQCTTVDDGYTLALAIISRIDILLKQNDYIHAYKDLKILSNFKVPFLNTTRIFQKVYLCRSRSELLSLAEFETKCAHESIDGFGHFNSLSPSVSNSVKIKITKSAGKAAVANSVINPGDALVIENPIASCLLPEFYNSHCQTCLKRCKILYGCPDCSTVSFCSYKCRNIALQSFHKYECKLSSTLIGSGMSILCFMSLRIVTQLGLGKCLVIFRYLYEGYTQDSSYLEFENYLKLYKLESHASERSTINFFERSLIAVFLVQCLKQVNFFNDDINHNKTSKNSLKAYNTCEAEIIIGTLLLRHMQILQFNTYEISEPNIGDSNIIDKGIKYIGVGIYPNAARFNHECNPATIRYFNRNVIILRSNKLLQRNDIIAENYGPVFTTRVCKDRQRYLAGRYLFNCCCQPCVNNWPLLTDMDWNQLQIICSSKDCSGRFILYLNTNFEETYFCVNCNASFKFSRLHQNIIKKCIIWYAYGTTIMNQKYIPEAIQILITALKIFHHVATVPHRFTHLAEISLQNCLMNN